MRNNRDIQKLGEDAAAALLVREGWTVLHRNWSLRLGELDLVVRRGGCLAFVEVKARLGPAFVDPALGVDWRKQRLRNLFWYDWNHRPDVAKAAANFMAWLLRRETQERLEAACLAEHDEGAAALLSHAEGVVAGLVRG